MSKTTRNSQTGSYITCENHFKIRTGWAVEFIDPSGNNLGITDYNQ
jgi:predicted enzyme related to lactoylglutathione lyase